MTIIEGIVQTAVFTFHNVSINSEETQAQNDEEAYLHSTMFLLIPLILTKKF